MFRFAALLLAAVCLCGAGGARAQATIAVQVRNNPLLTTLSAALTDSSLVATFDGAGPFTLFAPTDAAFRRLPADIMQVRLITHGSVIIVHLYSVYFRSLPFFTVPDACWYNGCVCCLLLFAVLLFCHTRAHTTTIHFHAGDERTIVCTI
jgi:hypothetical protein